MLTPYLAMGYLRAVMFNKEYSPRCLSLTNYIIGMNPAHYTVWLYRFELVEALHVPVDLEIEWLNKVALAHLKNYQIWHHRQNLLELAIQALPDDASARAAAVEKLARSEVAFLTRMLDADTKNYHVWSYRQRLVGKLGLWPSNAPLGPDELAATMKLIEADVRNNSAWSHRFYLVFSDPAICTGELSALVADPKVPADVIDCELELAKQHIRKAPQNQSGWNYMRGVLAKGGRRFEELVPFALEFVELGGGVKGEDDDDKKEDVVRSSHALELLADHFEQKGDRTEAFRYWDLLIGKWDAVRAGYWQYRKKQIGE